MTPVSIPDVRMIRGISCTRNFQPFMTRIMANRYIHLNMIPWRWRPMNFLDVVFRARVIFYINQQALCIIVRPPLVKL